MAARGGRRRTAAVLAVGGSDPTASAGIQADVRTLEAFGVVPATAVTAVTVQDGRRVRSVGAVAARLVGQQIEAALGAFAVRVVKTGMLARPSTVRVVARMIAGHGGLKLVVDPVLAASGGEPLASPAVQRTLTSELVPLAAVVTPNTEEASRLAGIEVRGVDDAIEAARRIVSLGARAVVVTGGHLRTQVSDVLVTRRRVRVWRAGRLGGGGMHGTGCAFAAAIAAGLARGDSLESSVGAARAHVRRLLAHCLRASNGARLRRPRTG